MWELCKCLGKTPLEMGDLKRRNPDAYKFCELAYIREKEREYRAYKEAEKKAKRKR